jgi:hypothetical protein
MRFMNFLLNLHRPPCGMRHFADNPPLFSSWRFSQSVAKRLKP